MAEPSVMVITGTRKGIGRWLAEYYLERGWIVAGCSREDSDLKHERYHHYCADVADEKAARAMFVDLGKRFGRVDALLNNAASSSFCAYRYGHAGFPHTQMC